MWDAPMPHGGGVQHYDSYTIVRNMDKLFDDIEGGHSNEQKWERSEKRDLKTKLSCQESDIGDWKIAKCIEYSTLGMESTYDLQELHNQRQLVRDEIGVLEKEFAKCKEEDILAEEQAIWQAIRDYSLS